MADQPTSPSRLTTRQRRTLSKLVLNAMLEAKLKGISDADLAESFGLTVREVNSALDRYLDHINIPTVERYRKIQALRYEQVINSLQPDVERAKIPAIAQWRNVMSDLNKLVGANAPEVTKHEEKIELDVRQTISNKLSELSTRIANPPSLPTPHVTLQPDDYIEGETVDDAPTTVDDTPTTHIT